VTLSKRGADRLRRGQVWVFRVDVLGDPDVEPGETVRILDPRGNHLGHGFYGAGELRLRLLTREDRVPDEAILRDRLRTSIERRAALAGARDAARLVHAEADLLPGLLVDRFGDGVVVQSLCAAWDRREETVVGWLRELLAPRVVVVRDDGATRDLERLPRRAFLAHGEDPRVRYHEGALGFEADLLSDQKTGGFLDQKENHLRAGEYARAAPGGQGLDLFSFHGGFGLQLGGAMDRTVCVEQNPLAVARARANAEANGLSAKVEVEEGNAFDRLRLAQERGERYRMIVIDPPAFAKRKGADPKGALESALRGYRDLNLRALRVLEPGGILISCSCSGKVTRAIFEEMLESAAVDARRKLAVLERRGAGRDHPVLLGVPETDYLKCFVLRALD
jgi:23S rRNA (cytosine1962-C5)-methyltransferase